ncbi:MAG: hypothetical protein ABUK01_15970 [Leptospirales bacterium]
MTISLFSTGLIFQFVCFLWIGQYIHPEFGDGQLFLKHRPHLQWTFSSPTGESDLQLEDLNEDDRYRELLYEEFVLQRDHLNVREEIILLLFNILYILGNQLLLLGLFYLLQGKGVGIVLNIKQLLLLFGISLISQIFTHIFLVGYWNQNYTLLMYCYIIAPTAYLYYLFSSKKNQSEE